MESEFEASAGTQPPDATTSSSELTSEDIILAFQGKSPDVALSSPSALSSGLTTLLVQLLVPGIYFALLSGVGWAVFMLAFYTKPDLVEGMPSPRTFIGWAAPILAGIVLLYYMIKPLFIRRNELEAATVILPDEQPVLWSFIRKLSRAANAPSPARIFADCKARVKVMPVQNPAEGNEPAGLDLIIGLPLMAGLNVRQFAAAIACELATFQDTPGAHSARQLHKVVGWLGNIAAYRDSVDETIEDACETGSKYWRPLAYVTRWLVRMIRSLLRGLLFMAVLLARRVANLQQFAADAAAGRIAGPQEFRAMVKNVLMLEGSVLLAERNLRRYQTERLPDDFPTFVSETERRLPSGLRHDFQFKVESDQALLTPLQTSNSMRIQKSMELGRSSQIELQRPATDLVTDFLSLSRETSRRHYAKLFGEDIASKAWLIPNDEFMRQEEERGAFGTTLCDEMIDPHEGDEWHKWLKPLSTVGSILFTVGLVFHAANNLARLNESAETKFRRHIGNWIILPHAGVRQILGVKYFKEGDVAGYRKKDTSLAHAFIKNDEKEGIEVASTGWYYDTGKGFVVRCDLQEKRAFLYEKPTGGEDEEEKFRKEVGGDED